MLVEGESDVHTLWHHGIPAIGLPGATNWREDRDAKWFDGIETIYIVIEPDKGGQSVRKWLAQSAIRARAKLLQLPAKDPSAMHIADPTGFKRAWQAALLGGGPLDRGGSRASAPRSGRGMGGVLPIWPVPKTSWRSLTGARDDRSGWRASSRQADLFGGHVSATGPSRVDRGQGTVLGRQIIYGRVGIAVLSRRGVLRAHCNERSRRSRIRPNH